MDYYNGIVTCYIVIKKSLLQSSVLVFIGMILFSVFLSQNAFAEFSNDEKVKFTTVIEQIKGHIVAANENQEIGNNDLAKLHLSHPLEENQVQLENLLKHQQTSQNTELILFMITNLDTDVSHETFNNSALAVTKLLDALKENVIDPQNDLMLDLLVINRLLEISKLEYDIGKSFSGVIGILEIQDSHAFAIRAHILFTEIDEIKTEDKGDINLIFMELFEKYNQEESVYVIVGLEDQITNKINKIISDLVSTTTDDQSIPSWIKNNAKWWAGEQIDDTAFLQGIEYLIKKDILIIPPTEPSGILESGKIPDWIKNTASWWAEGQIDDDTFVSGIQFLIEKQIVIVN